MNKMKRIKILLSLILIILVVGIAERLGGGEGTDRGEELKVVAVYYVPVTNYFSAIDNFVPSPGQKFYLKTEDREILNGKIAGQVLDWSSDKELSEGEVGIVRWDRVRPNQKTLSYNGKYLWNKDEAIDYGLKFDKKMTEVEAGRVLFESDKITKINFLGDIMLSRHVNTQMKRFGYDYPWQKVADQIADADITFANLEVPISDRFNVPASGMSFVASTANLEHLKSAGIDIVSVANNHTANFGAQAFTDNLANLKRAGIKVCGGGLNETEARRAPNVTVNNINFSFLCQSAITGSLYADNDNPGVPYLGIEPWYRRNQNSLNDLVADIETARANVLIDSPHWGIEYKQYPNADQQAVARLMVDNGADLVIGTHPHVVQSLEYYEGKYITYSLGNFIFDQEWSTETKQGVMASAYFYGEKNVSVRLVPLQIENYAQPRFVTEATARKILGDIRRSSVGF